MRPVDRLQAHRRRILPRRESGPLRWHRTQILPAGIDLLARRLGLLPLSAEPCSYPLQASEIALPAIVCSLVVGFVFRPEARLLHAHENALLRRRQRPRDDRLEAARRFSARRVPAVGEPLIGLYDEHLTVDHAV